MESYNSKRSKVPAAESGGAGRGDGYPTVVEDTEGAAPAAVATDVGANLPGAEASEDPDALDDVVAPPIQEPRGAQHLMASLLARYGDDAGPKVSSLGRIVRALQEAVATNGSEGHGAVQQARATAARDVAAVLPGHPDLIFEALAFLPAAPPDLSPEMLSLHASGSLAAEALPLLRRTGARSRRATNQLLTE